MQNELKPCPFCGHKAVLNISYDSMYIVQCICGCGTLHYKTAQEATDKWNNRAEQSKWIPCSERLPSDSERIDERGQDRRFICFVAGRRGVEIFKFDGEFFYSYDNIKICLEPETILAWQPLPEPYVEV